MNELDEFFNDFNEATGPKELFYFDFDQARPELKESIETPNFTPIKIKEKEPTRLKVKSFERPKNKNKNALL